MAHYDLKRKLGAGAMGEVWLAIDLVLEREVAVKLIPAAIAMDAERRTRFLREAKLAAKLSHPNAVSVYQAGIENDSVFVVMELLNGESLDKTIATRGLMDWREATRVICDAAKGLAAAHELGLVHRDIKPANLMRTVKGVTKVVDFGLAREVLSNSQLTREGTLMGTPAYMSPEQWIGGEADARSDLYSLICTYYFLITGQLPFDAPSLPSLGYQHRYEPFPDPAQLVADLPPEISRVVTRGSQKEPADRYQHAAELIAELEALLNETNENGSSANKAHSHPLTAQKSQVSSPVASLQNRFWSKIPPRWRRLAIGGLALPLLVVLGVVFLVRTPEGTIQFELNDPQAKVEFKVDGNIVEVMENGKPLRFRAGEHQLRVTGADFETVTETFTVKRGDNPVYQVRLVPTKKNAATTTDSSTEPTADKSADELTATLTGKKLAPPTSRVAELQRAARAAMSTELASSDPANLSSAAKLFLTRVDSLEQPDEKFALEDLARDLLSQAGDLRGSLDVCARMDREFVIDIAALKVKTLQRLAKTAGTPKAKEQLLETVLTTGFEALAANSFGPCRNAAKLAADMTQMPDSPVELVYQAGFLTEELERAESAYARLSAAAKAAVDVTDDLQANSERGRFTCLVKNDWSKGADLLRAGLAPWPALVEREEKRPTSAWDRVTLGDLWWQAAEGLPPEDAQDARRRARHWYLGALAKLSPMERETTAERLQPRIDQVPRTPTTLRVRLGGLSGFHWLRISSDGVQTTNRGSRKITGNIQVNHLRWKDHVAGHRNSGATRLLPDGIDFSTTNLTNLSQGRWGAVHIATSPESVDLTFWHSPANETSHFDLVLKMETGGYDVPTRFARQWDVAYYNWPEKTPPTDDNARAALFKGESADRIKTDSINFVSESSPTDAWRPGAPPSKKVTPDRFALVATSDRELPAGRYKVLTYADDGVRVLIDGQVALDNWRANGNFHATSEELRLTAGVHQIRVEYYQITGSALLQFGLRRLGDN